MAVAGDEQTTIPPTGQFGRKKSSGNMPKPNINVKTFLEDSDRLEKSRRLGNCLQVQVDRRRPASLPGPRCRRRSRRYPPTPAPPRPIRAARVRILLGQPALEKVSLMEPSIGIPQAPSQCRSLQREQWRSHTGQRAKRFVSRSSANIFCSMPSDIKIDPDCTVPAFDEEADVGVFISLPKLTDKLSALRERPQSNPGLPKIVANCSEKEIDGQERLGMRCSSPAPTNAISG